MSDTNDAEQPQASRPSDGSEYKYDDPAWDRLDISKLSMMRPDVDSMGLQKVLERYSVGETRPPLLEQLRDFLKTSGRSEDLKELEMRLHELLSEKVRGQQTPTTEQQSDATSEDNKIDNS